ncbi:hypothetical protein [Paenibacillus sp. PL2-23]|uniref:hypothetical protein n=1 Tax=Paenibacillus sp. PL2-23 TaxID=2100729 RepID=UPI0030F84591
MKPISIEKFVTLYLQSNPNENRQDMLKKLRLAVTAKHEGTCCIQCAEPIWAVGTAIAGWNVCFTCLTGEADDSKDYEVVNKFR